jgi:hypothetical protein
METPRWASSIMAWKSPKEMEVFMGKS